MKKRYVRPIAVFSVLALLTPSALFAADKEFNPNFLISDEEMQFANSMTSTDIQAFLESHGGYLKNLRTTDVSSTQRMASDIIYRASQRHKINPKYLLVKLQKEQSLISDASPTQKQLDWATGYGICDACSMSDPTLQKHRGFGTQVDSAAGIMRWYYDNLAKESWIKRSNTAYTIDGQRVVPSTLATAFLYTYTPHIHGNKNFWTLWNRWFEQVYPDGSLVKTPDDPTVYAILNGQRRPFDSMTALISRFDPKLVLEVPASELSRYTLGPSITLPNYAILKEGSRYYLLDFDTLRPFESEAVVKKLGYHPDEIIDVSAADISGYALGETITAGTTAPLGELVRVKENGSLYYVAGNTFAPIGSDMIAQITFPHLSITPAPISRLQGLTRTEPIVFKDGILFGVEGYNEIYVVEHGKRRHIASEDVFNGMGYDWGNIIWVDELTGLAHPTGQPLYLQREIQVADAPTPTISQEILEASEKMYKTPIEDTTYVGEHFPAVMNTYLVADAATGKVLAGKNIDDVRPLASLTKVMTAYRLEQEGLRKARYVTYDPAEHKSMYHRFRIAEGEKVKNQDLFDALLISSLNTPAHMLVSSVESNESAFIARMNEQTVAWGLDNTAFADPSGAALENISTAREYATLYAMATKLGTVKETLGSPSYRYSEVLDTDGKPDHFDTHSNDLMERTDLPYTIISSKTGYLDESGANLAMHIRRPSDGKEFLIITMGNPNLADRFSEPDSLARWTLDLF